MTPTPDPRPRRTRSTACVALALAAVGLALLVGAAPQTLSNAPRAITVVEGADAGVAAEAVHELVAATGLSTRSAVLRAAPAALALALVASLLRRHGQGAWRPGVWPAPANRPPPALLR